MSMAAADENEMLQEGHSCAIVEIARRSQLPSVALHPQLFSSSLYMVSWRSGDDRGEFMVTFKRLIREPWRAQDMKRPILWQAPLRSCGVSVLRP
jgi:hypothetical protein